MYEYKFVRINSSLNSFQEHLKAIIKRSLIHMLRKDGNLYRFLLLRRQDMDPLHILR